MSAAWSVRSKASRSTNEIRGLAFAAAGKHWLHLPDEEAEAERSKSTERKAAPKDATPQDAAPKEAAPGARVCVETRPEQEPKGGRVATRKRGIEDLVVQAEALAGSMPAGVKAANRKIP